MSWWNHSFLPGPVSLVSRFVTKLLEDLVFFVCDIPNTGQDVLEIMVNKPNRERQKLMREQNILKQVHLIVQYSGSIIYIGFG